MEVVDEAVLIRHYKKLLSELDHHEEELRQPGNEHVVGYMHDVQKLFSQIKSPKPLCLDAKVTHRVSGIVREQSHQMSSNIINFNLEEYTAKILQKLEVQPGTKMRSQSFVKLGSSLSTKFRRSPALTFLHGAVPSQPLEAEKEKPARRVQAREPKTALKETCTLDINQNRNNPGQLDGTEEMVGQAFRCLVRQFKKNERQPVDFFMFIIDPESFSKTIENLFHVSFLVKEGRAAVRLGRETGGLPVISPLSRDPKKDPEDDVVSNQVVINMTMRDWKVFAKKYRGRLPLIS